MSFGEVRRITSLVEGDWVEQCCVSGLSSGEGLIWAIRDPVVDRQGGEEKIADLGVTDKRLLVQEGELSQALQAIARDGNTLSAIIRLAWDGAPLRPLTKNAKGACLLPHISIIGHITVAELQRLLTTTDTANGFANRFLWVCAARSRCLPFGGNVDRHAILRLAASIREAIDFARNVRDITFGLDTREQWESVYPDLSAARPGLLGAVTARAEAQTLRLAMIYALLDRSASIQPQHLRAALAVWKYCEDSARFIFGDKLGDPTADQIMRLLRGAVGGVTRNEIIDHFKRNKTSSEISRALTLLQSLGLARSCSVDTGGRPAELWFSTGRI